MSTDIIITHVDPDGMVSAILLMKFATPDARIKFTNGRKLITKLEEVLNSEPKPANLYLTDLPLVADTRMAVLAALEALQSSGVHIHVIDHHFGWEHAAVKPSMFSTFQVNTRKTTAAKLVWDQVGPSSNGNEIWLSVLSQKDESADLEVSERFALLVALMHHRKNREVVLRECAQDSPVRQIYHELIHWYFHDQIPFEQGIAAKAEIITTRYGKTIGWVDLRQVKRLVNVTRHVIDQHGVDLVATAYSDAVLVGCRHIDAIDLSQIRAPATVVGIYTIVGHRSPIHIQWKGLTDEMALQEIRQWLPAEL